MIRKKWTVKKKGSVALLLAGLLAFMAIYRAPAMGTAAFAWWGTMYPQYCFSQDAGEDMQEDAPIQIRFRWLPIK